MPDPEPKPNAPFNADEVAKIRERMTNDLRAVSRPGYHRTWEDPIAQAILEVTARELAKLYGDLRARIDELEVALDRVIADEANPREQTIG